MLFGPEQTQLAIRQKRTRVSFVLIFIISLAVAISAIYVSKEVEADAKQQPDASTTFTPSKTLHAEYVRNGEILYRRSPEEYAIAPFSVTTRGGKDYYVKLRNLSKKDEVTFFVYGGKTAEIKVPLGDYELLYACGSIWCGTTDLFGPETYYAKADEIFSFYEDDGYVNGWSVELYLQADGNLSAETISPEDFQ